MDKSKPESVKIIHIATDHADLNQTVYIFGLGDDDIIYQWDTLSSGWHRWSRT